MKGVIGAAILVLMALAVGSAETEMPKAKVESFFGRLQKGNVAPAYDPLFKGSSLSGAAAETKTDSCPHPFNKPSAFRFGAQKDEAARLKPEEEGSSLFQTLDVAEGPPILMSQSFRQNSWIDISPLLH